MKAGYEFVAIVIPSYNESANITLLLPLISKVLPKSTVLIVDDSGESEFLKVKKLTLKGYGIKTQAYSRKKKDGRGSAVVYGMGQAVKMKHIRYIVEMDADLAHDPREIPLLMKHSERAELVIGSRYTTGSKIQDWPLRRLVQSRIINLFLNLWLGLSLTDYTNGFRLYSKKAAEFLVSHPPKQKGFIALSEIAYQLKKNGFTITEAPVSFTDRKYGTSNADISELLRSLFGAIRIRLS